jgi:hypothetical protein
MFEDFRNQADESAFPVQEEEFDNLRDGLALNRSPQLFLGMTAIQRFAISILLFLMTCVLGALFLFVTERVVPPIFGY